MPLIEPGCLLVASPNVQGPYARAVVLICAAEGPSAQGLVLNQPFGDDDSMAPREVRRRIAERRARDVRHPDHLDTRLCADTLHHQSTLEGRHSQEV